MLVKMKDICTKIGSGATPKGGNNAYIDEGISLIRSQNILDFSFSHDGLAHINDEQAAKLNGVTIEEDDILLNITGDSVARACMVDNSILPARVNQHVCIVRADKRKVLSSFILYYLQMKKPELLMMASSGATRNALTKGMIEELEIDLPSLVEQKRIVTLIDNLQYKILNNNQINRNLSEQIKALYTESFINNGENCTAMPLEDFIFFQEGPGIRNWQYVDDGVKFINIRCINNEEINTVTANKISVEEANGKYAHFLLKPLDIVMSCSGTLGRYAIVQEKHLPLCLNTSVIRFRPKLNEDDYAFVYGYLGSDEFLNQQKSMANGSAQVNFGPTHLKKMIINVPSKEKREKFNQLVMPMIYKKLSTMEENSKLVALRDSLLPKLMSGELDVSDLNI